MSLTIGQVAKAANVHVETLRYYERRGLVPKPPRGSSLYRRYPEDTVLRVQFVKHAQDLGFSLREIRMAALAAAVGPWWHRALGGPGLPAARAVGE